MATIPNMSMAAIEVDSGWSDDGMEYGYCNPSTLPDTAGGCFFFDRNSLKWVEVSRKGALLKWKPWQSGKQKLYVYPITAVHPLDEESKEKGPRLLGRITETDAVTEIWKAKQEEEPDEKGSEWKVVFDYSPDGKWLTAGAIRVDFSNSQNHIHIIVRPTSHWLALAWERSAIDMFASGRLKDGIARLGKAASIFEKILSKNDDEFMPEQIKITAKKPSINEEDNFQKAWIEEGARISWSNDGKKLCVCDAWEDPVEGKRASCRVFDVKNGSWNPIIYEKTRFVCPVVKENNRENFWIDWGKKEDKIVIVIYKILHGKNRIVEIMKKEIDVDSKYCKFCMDTSADWIYDLVAITSPDEKFIALGFARIASDKSIIEYNVEVRQYPINTE